MPRMFDLVGKLDVRGHQYNDPDWWNTAHKLKKRIKAGEFLKTLGKDANFKTQLKVSTISDQPELDTFIHEALTNLESGEKYSEIAPWNPVFRKTKTILTFKK